jgi:hypothetical protein
MKNINIVPKLLNKRTCRTVLRGFMPNHAGLKTCARRQEKHAHASGQSLVGGV